jgi:Domain of Unknown Function (DUF1080)
MTTLLRAATLTLAVFFMGTFQAPADDAPKKEDGWISLFNGKDLTGWTPKITGYAAGDNYGDTFRVEDGILKVGYDKYPKFDAKFGHLFSKQSYSNYRLRIEYRFVGEQCPGGPAWALRNSGVMIHSQHVDSMRKDQEFPVSIEVQFLGGGEKGERHTGNVCTPGTHIVMDGKLITQHCNDSKSKTYRGAEWVTIEAEVHGNGKIIHKVNGEPVISYEKPQYDTGDADAKKLMKEGKTALSEGYLALQAESHPIEFRKVEILPLKD